MIRRFAPVIAGASVASEGQLPAKVWQLGAAPAARPNVRPVLEPVLPKEAGNELCALCKLSLSQGCLRFRTCGHVVHAACLNEHLRGSNRFRGVKRSTCPECGEIWIEGARSPKAHSSKTSLTAPKQLDHLSTLLAYGLPSECTCGRSKPSKG
eukprot:TRINITY_DN84069_c0_g1_i1.p1 TRINITY_DN84069_c0_g1~~TRINITY_DN84069_c0_g1_i1.p1  ORF type:complete len:153 (-),score=10.71 TRINITY_DN84069_c0_g1_i1:2-460(-)